MASAVRRVTRAHRRRKDPPDPRAWLHLKARRGQKVCRRHRLGHPAARCRRLPSLQQVLDRAPAPICPDPSASKTCARTGASASRTAARRKVIQEPGNRIDRQREQPRRHPPRRSRTLQPPPRGQIGASRRRQRRDVLRAVRRRAHRHRGGWQRPPAQPLSPRPRRPRAQHHRQPPLLSQSRRGRRHRRDRGHHRPQSAAATRHHSA